MIREWEAVCRKKERERKREREIKRDIKRESERERVRERRRRIDGLRSDHGEDMAGSNFLHIYK